MKQMNVLFYTKLNDTWKQELTKLNNQFPEVNFIAETNPGPNILTEADIMSVVLFQKI